MDSKEAIERIKRSLTGGKVRLELKDVDDTIKANLKRALQKVAPWYDEKLRQVVGINAAVQDPFVSGYQTTGYVEANVFVQLPDDIVSVYPITEAFRTQSYSLVTQLLDLPTNYLGNEQNIIDYAYWRMVEPQLRRFLENELVYEWLGDKLLVTGYPRDCSQLVVEFTFVPRELEHVKFQPALDWLLEYAEALTSLEVSQVRGKYTGGGLQFDTNASEMRSSAEEKIREMDERLPRLYFGMDVGVSDKGL